MALQVMDKLGIDKAFALGTSQGGWMVTRMALLAPERVRHFVFILLSFNYMSLAPIPRAPYREDSCIIKLTLQDNWTPHPRHLA